MSGLARFSVVEVPLGFDDASARQWRLSCPHGETVMSHLFGPPPDDTDVLALLQARHEKAERCGCAASVARKEARA